MYSSLLVGQLACTEKFGEGVKAFHSDTCVFFLLKKVDCLHDPSTTNPEKKNHRLQLPTDTPCAFGVSGTKWAMTTCHRFGVWLSSVIVLMYGCHRSLLWNLNGKKQMGISSHSHVAHFALKRLGASTEFHLIIHHILDLWPFPLSRSILHEEANHQHLNGQVATLQQSLSFQHHVGQGLQMRLCREANKLLNAVISTSATPDAVHERGSIQISKNVICNFLKKPIKGTCRVCLYLVIERSQGGVMWFLRSSPPGRDDVSASIFRWPGNSTKGTKTSIYISSLESWVVDPRYTTRFVPVYSTNLDFAWNFRRFPFQKTAFCGHKTRVLRSLQFDQTTITYPAFDPTLPLTLTLKVLLDVDMGKPVFLGNPNLTSGTQLKPKIFKSSDERIKSALLGGFFWRGGGREGKGKRSGSGWRIEFVHLFFCWWACCHAFSDKQMTYNMELWNFDICNPCVISWSLWSTQKTRKKTFLIPLEYPYLGTTPHPVTVTIRMILFLVGNPYKPSVGGFNPFEKYKSKWESSSNRCENKRCLKPPTSIHIPSKEITANKSWKLMGLEDKHAFSSECWPLFDPSGL